MGSLWTDTEIRSADEDRLNRAAFIGSIAKLVSEVPDGSPSVVFGLTGTWGSGKSSILCLVEKSLAGGVTCAWFSPWSVTDETGLLTEFFSTILSSSLVFKDKKNRQALSLLLRKSMPALGLVPGIGSALANTANSFLSETNWRTQFTRVEEILLREDLRILIIVDDVDRLHGDELLALIKTIRMVGRFRNVHYLLAYDHDAVIDTLEAKLGNRARASGYLEKIVQYPLPIPPVQLVHLRAILEEGFAPLIQTMAPARRVLFAERFEWLQRDVLSKAIRTVRSAKRLIAQTSHYFLLAGPEEVELEDFVALTFLRLQYPKVYAELESSRDLMATGTALSIDYGDVQMEDSFWTERLQRISSDDPSQLEIIRAVLAFLFQRPEEDSNNPRWWSSSTREERSRRVMRRDYFDRYFHFGIPEGDVSDQAVETDVAYILSSESEDYKTSDFSRTFCASSPSVVKTATVKARAFTQFMAADPQADARLTSFALWLLSRCDESVAEEVSGWLGALLRQHSVYKDQEEYRRVVNNLPNVARLAPALREATATTASLGKERWRTEYPALFQLRNAVIDVCVGQISAVVHYPPYEQYRERFFDAYTLIHLSDGLASAKQVLSGRIMAGQLSLVSLTAYCCDYVRYVPDAPVGIDLLNLLVEDDVLFTAVITDTPSWAASDAELVHEFTEAVRIIEEWRSQQPTGEVQ